MHEIYIARYQKDGSKLNIKAITSFNIQTNGQILWNQ